MANSKISDLTALTTPASGDLIPIVDVSDTTQAASGTTKKITYANLTPFAPTASPTFTGTVVIPTPFTIGAVSMTATGTELNFVDGVTSAIQTQLDAKLPSLMTVPTSDGTATGPVTSAFVSGYTSSAIGDLVYLDSSSKWQKVDADAIATTTGLLGIALAVAATDAALLVALPGSFVYSTAFPTFTVGVPVYAGETPGAVSASVPTGTDGVVRVIGFAVHADKIYFNPSPDNITIV